MVPPPVTDKGGLTRQRILDVAAERFLERGYNATSLNELIKATGLTKGGFYFHFASKAELGLAALDMIRDQYRARIFSEAGAHPRAADQIAAMVRVIAATHEKQATSAEIGRLCQELSAAPEVGAEKIRPFEAWYVLVADLFRRAQAQGDMDPEIDAESAAVFVVDAYLGMDHVAEVDDDDGYPRRHVENYLFYTFKAVGMRVPVPDTGLAADLSTAAPGTTN